MNKSPVKIGFIGFGNMASAMARGLIASGVVKPEEIAAVAKHYEGLKARTAALGIGAYASARELVQDAAVIVIAVKPYLVKEVLAEFSDIVGTKPIISVAVGLHYADLQTMLPQDAHILATLPNTPVAVGEGVIVCEQTHSLSDDDLALISPLFDAMGMAVFVPAQHLGVAGTISGCGPAFAALFLEGLADGAVKNGLPRAQAYQLTAQMMAGTAKLALKEGLHPGQLKDAVCSPGGTTIVGVCALESHGFRHALIDAIDQIQNK